MRTSDERREVAARLREYAGPGVLMPPRDARDSMCELADLMDPGKGGCDE